LLFLLPPYHAEMKNINYGIYGRIFSQKRRSNASDYETQIFSRPYRGE
jgi:hypothetical protein